MTAQEEISLKYRKKWLKMLKEVCLNYIDRDKYAVFLFGSAVSDILRANDVDIGVLGRKELPQNIKSVIYNVVEESVIPFRIDIVDFHVAGKRFKKIALSSIKVWNKPGHIKLN
ncbi:MAG TPA: hypothetical protein VJ455_09410 [Ignavibacteria bacterium]|nr:hypothetical protein [Ignavibacteria bacterium]